jgi:hypothetical protein
MATTYTLINSTTVGSGGTASVTFSSIPATYTDLVVKSSIRCDANNADAGLYLNGSSATTSFIELFGNGASTSSVSRSYDLLLMNPSSSTSNTFSNTEHYIPNYASSNYKSVSLDSLTENNGTTAYIRVGAMLWSNTSAVTSVTLYPGSGNFVQYSSFYLYGINNS